MLLTDPINEWQAVHYHMIEKNLDLAEASFKAALRLKSGEYSQTVQ